MNLKKALHTAIGLCCLIAPGILCSFTVAEYDSLTVAAPFPMPAIPIYNFPHQDFDIRDFGAKRQDEASDEECVAANTAAFRAAMEACNAAGGGRVVVPEGSWSSGPIHFCSRCNLYLSEGAKVLFSDRPEDYLPAVETSWEGLECYNYSPLVYAFQCHDIAISGTGTLAPRMETWKVWFARPQAHLNALAQLYNWGSFDEPVINRQMAVGENHLRPHLIQFNQCSNVLLEDFKIRESPFWTIHLYRVTNGVARRLDVYAHGHNNDGIDLEMSRNVLVEDCTFDQGDDAVVIKSGRNHDAWRIGQPTENVVVRNCTIRKGHVLLGIGSEMSAGVRNVYMHDCTAPGKVLNLFYLKTNRRRGGFIENIYMERVSAGEMQRAMAIDTDVLYQWKDLVPTYKDTVTQISHIFMKDVHCNVADGIYELNGDADLPVQDVHIEDIHVDRVRKYTYRARNVEGLEVRDVTWQTLESEPQPEPGK
jgi:polygalacturonase